jgi:hypothetical protein
MKRIIIICVVIISISVSATFAETPLDLIAIFHSDSSSGALWWGYASPGDINGDSYSEIFAKELGSTQRMLVYSGGNPPDTMYDMEFSGGVGARPAWLPDINNDGYEDFAATGKYVYGIEDVQVWFGGPQFMSKTEPDLVFRHIPDTVSAFGYTISAGDINGDGQNDIVISAVNWEVPGYEGRFYIFFGGTLLDTTADVIISIYDHGIGYDDFVNGTCIGDINGDGFADLCYSGQPSTYDPGYVAIILGSVPYDTIPDFVVWSPWGSTFGSQSFGDGIVPLGDMNKDGYDDFAVTGSVVWPCVFHGSSPFVPIPEILGDTTDHYTRGDVLSNIGDINHDGWDDIGVGSPSVLQDSRFFIFFGYRPLDTHADITFLGSQAYPYAGMQFGMSVVPAGDFNGDGIDDVMVTFRQWFGGPFDRGCVYIFAGSSELPTSAEEVGEETDLPNSYNILEQNHPNPFNDETTITYRLAGASHRVVEISIYNMLGQKVRTLVHNYQSGGIHTVTWDGTDNDGEPVSSGVYFYRLKSDLQTLSKKMTLMK